MTGNTPIIFIVFLSSILIPVGLMLWWKRKSGATLWPFLVGAICFTLFAMVLETMLHGVCLMSDNPVSRVLTGSPVLYTLYACLAAGIFEETGRLFGYKIMLKGRNQPANAVAYGIGHGGMEVILILTTAYAVLLLAKAGVSFGSEEATATVRSAADALVPVTAATALFERVSAMLAHVGLSMMVFPAARDRGRFWLYPVAVLCHGLLDLPAALFQYKVITQIWVVEALAFVCGLALLLLGRRALRAYSARH